MTRPGVSDSQPMRAVRAALARTRTTTGVDEQLVRAVIGLFKFARPAPPQEWKSCWRYYPCEPHCSPRCRDPFHGERLMYPLPVHVPAQRGASDAETTQPIRTVHIPRRRPT